MDYSVSQQAAFYSEWVAAFATSERQLDQIWGQWWYRIMTLPALPIRPLLRIGRWLVRRRLLYFQQVFRRANETGYKPRIVLWVAALESLFPDAHRILYGVFFHFLVFVEAVWCFAVYSATWLEGGAHGGLVLLAISLVAFVVLMAELRKRTAT